MYPHPLCCSYKPEAPANYDFTPDSRTITLSWPKPNDGGSPILFYDIEVGGGTDVHTIAAPGGSGAVEFTLVGLVPLSTHTFKVGLNPNP